MSPAALPVVELIRKHVPRPKELPEPAHESGVCLRWWVSMRGRCCPMGMLPGVHSFTPMEAEDLGRFSNVVKRSDVQAFYKWWDCQTDPIAAVDAVWGEPSNPNGKASE